ncbi:MAG: elongation factor G [Ignavibacteria bacterium]|nr:elongation factor G [Ignavibacteria bacterium]
MNIYETKQIRNIALAGHFNTGKTTFVDCLLFNTGAINRRGTIEENSTQSDFNEIEHERKSSVLSSVLFIEKDNKKINIIDTPGTDDFIAEMIAGLNVVETSVIFVNAQNGTEVGTENAWNYSQKFKLATIFAINKLDLDQANFTNTFSQLREIFGRKVIAFHIPVSVGPSFKSFYNILDLKLYEYNDDKGKATIKDIPESDLKKIEPFRNELLEMIAESDEALMDIYFQTGTIDDENLTTALKTAIINREIFPVLCIGSKNNIGTDYFIDFIVNFCPSPDEVEGRLTSSGNIQTVDPNSPPSLFIFKLTSEAHLGDLIFFKIQTGKIYPGIDLQNEQKQQLERLNQIFLINGKKRVEITQINAGDIGATVKLKVTQINHTLHEKGFNIEYEPIEFPNPRVRIAVAPKIKGEEEKVGTSLNSLHLEDPSLIVQHSPELRQIILYAQGEQHLSVAKWRLEHRYKVEVEFKEPRVPYRETIQKQVRGSYRHKKQTGGAGQFAEVHMLIEPYVENAPIPSEFSLRARDIYDLDWGGKLEFVNCIVGGVIDQRFMPAILKGVMEKMQEGPLTGSFVRDIRVIIYDGKMHPVDSNEAAFKTAGMMVFKENFVKAEPKILEPIYNVEIKVPEEFVGDVMSDLPSRRAVIIGIEGEGRYQKIKARMPLAELDKYSTALRSMTQAKATHTQSFAEYQVVPPQIQQKLIEEYKKRQEEEKE